MKTFPGGGVTKSNLSFPYDFLELFGYVTLIQIIFLGEDAPTRSPIFGNPKY